MKSLFRISFLFILMCSQFLCFESKAFEYEGSEVIGFSQFVEILEDPQGEMTLQDVIKSGNRFTTSDLDIPNLGVGPSTFWVKFKIKNASDIEDFILEYAYANVDEVYFYFKEKTNWEHVLISEDEVFSKRKYQQPNYLFDLHLPTGDEQTFYMKLKSGQQIMLPLNIGPPSKIIESNSKRTIYIALYVGIMFVMFLYNFFVYLTVRDKSYIFYVLHTALVAVTQVTLLGYGFEYFWPNSPWFAKQSVSVISALAGICAIEFFKVFLQTKFYVPKLHKASYLINFFYATCIFLSLSEQFNIAYNFNLLSAAIAAVYIMTVAVIIMLKGSRTALFYVIAWSVFIVGIVIYVMKDAGALPYTDFTVYVMPIGTAAETILLSFALADKISILKREKEASQAEALLISKENERIIKEQNITLEAKVVERTAVIQEKNKSLNDAINDLKTAQSQLVEAEKMASLGQLTAGIAHEINNPINFVTSSIIPLRRDVEDMMEIIDKYEEIIDENDLKNEFEEIEELKEELELDYLLNEIKSLLAGIQDGASRTAEIVKGLRIFSRVDEMDLKKVNLNEGLDATLVVLNSSLEGKVTVEKEYDNLPLVECQAGKVNQVFMNIINNGIQAVLGNDANEGKGILLIKTVNHEDVVSIHIKDTGMGMSEATRIKIFEPFFTTKEVGEGTGLGLSIVHSIMEAHNGKIEVESEVGVGTEFIITLPKNHNK